MTIIIVIVAILFCLQIVFAGIYVYGVFHKWTSNKLEKYEKLSNICWVLITLIVLITVFVHY